MAEAHRRWAAPLLAGLLLVLAPGVALAHGEEPHGEEPTMPPEEQTAPAEMGPGPERLAAHRARVTLELRATGGTSLGELVRLEATLLEADGMPVVDAPVAFYQRATYADLTGDAFLGVTRTDDRGVASIAVELRTSGDVSFSARFAGDRDRRPAEAGATVEVAGDRQLYEPEVGLRVPGVGVWWLLVLVGAVWGLYLLVARQVVGIARAGSTPGEAGARGIGRRRFLGSFLVPAGLVASVASLGSGLLALISRSPRTHWNLAADPASHLHARHRLTPVAHVGERSTPTLPPILEREVSFSREVLPILMEKGGPHTHPSVSSPPPHGVRLDSYAAIMGLEGTGREEEEAAHAEEAPRREAEEASGEHGHRLVVPGKPEESMLVMVLVDRARRMPPAVPLSEEEIQLIASWVAQGARDN